MKSKGVHFLEEPREESRGMVAAFSDLYGNKRDWLELKKRGKQASFDPSNET
ncbi:hypothetical protein ANAEL_03179 [Anaerolineales bacterium]|nr:hypothetical protein ANAEL_03179 [Anaerolineales bacterium]